MRPGTLRLCCASVHVSGKWAKAGHRTRDRRCRLDSRPKVPAARVMEAENSESSPDLDTGWRGSARDLAAHRGWDFQRAFDWVLVGYLMEGDSRPLLDLILRQKRPPGVRVTQYIAALIDRRFRALFPNPIFPYELRLVENRGRGRPRKGSAPTTATEPNLGGGGEPICPSAAESLQALYAGLRAIGEGRRPESSFWLVLAGALDFDGYKRDKGGNFPLKAKLVQSDGRIRPEST